MWKDFKKFAIKGNVIDLAVAVIIGGAFGLIIKSLVNDMVEARKTANKIASAEKRAKSYSAHVFAYLEKIRYHIDKLELIVDDEMWPLPKYRELLFSN